MSFVYNKDGSNRHGSSMYSSPRDRQLRLNNTVLSDASVAELRRELEALKTKISGTEEYHSDNINSLIEDAVRSNTDALVSEISTLKNRIETLNTIILSKDTIIESMQSHINNLTMLLSSEKTESNINNNSTRPEMQSVYIDPTTDNNSNVKSYINIEDVSKSSIKDSVGKLKSIFGGNRDE